jgi:hypothetical protein
MASSCTSGSCPRIANFSNPGVFNSGYTTGGTNQNNTLSINNAALTVANFRQASAAGGGSGGPGGTGGGGSGPWVASVTALTSTVTATWPLPPNGFVPSSYQVEIANAATGATVAIVNVGTTQFYSTALANGSYVLRVRATNDAGSAVTTSDVTFLVGPPVTSTVPFAPQDLRAELSAGRVTLTWNVSTGTPLFSGFIVDVGTAPSLSNLGSYDTGSTAFRLVSPQPTPGVYYVRVRARNAFGASAPSNEVIVYVPGSPATACPGAPVSRSRACRTLPSSRACGAGGGAPRRPYLASMSCLTKASMSCLTKLTTPSRPAT